MLNSLTLERIFVIIVYLKRDKDGCEMIYDTKPFREDKLKIWESDGNCHQLPNGTIKEKLNLDLIFESEPREVDIDSLPCICNVLIK